MIRRRLLAILAGVFVFALVIGSAALLSVDSDPLLAGLDDTLSCDADDAVTVTYQTSHTISGFQVDSVTVADIDPNCAGATLSVDVHDNAAGSIETVTTVIATTSETLPLTPTVLAEDVYGVAVLITGPVTP